MSSIPQTTESIEFLCSGCGRALKVPASAAGKRASCPQCNTVVQVPSYFDQQVGAATLAVPPGSPFPPAKHGPPGRGGRELPPPPNPAAATLVLPAQPGVSSPLEALSGIRSP